MFSPGYRILFQGDSITDASRDRARLEPNDGAGLGRGYAFLSAARLLRDHPASDLRVHNRGISGNRVPDLQRRWAADTEELEPNLLSILIGVNDIWHKMEGRYSGSVQDYEDGFRALLEQTRRRLPSTRLVVGEPFALRFGAVTQHWFPEFDQRRAVAARIASEFGAAFIPFQSVLERAVGAGTSPTYWTTDGVHPTPQGHQLLADAWLETVLGPSQ
jgi:lysophospholipase L1-like esterase